MITAKQMQDEVTAFHDALEGDSGDAEIDAASALADTVESLIPSIAILEAYKRLHDGLSDMIAGGRLRKEDIPDDYQWLVNSLAKIAAMPTVADGVPVVEELEDLRAICESGLKAGEIWRPSVVAEQDEDGTWYWEDTREDTPNGEEGFATEREALEAAIAFHGRED